MYLVAYLEIGNHSNGERKRDSMHSFIHVNLDMVMTFRSGSSVGMYKEPVWFLRKTVEMLVSALCACYSFVCTLCPGQ